MMAGEAGIRPSDPRGDSCGGGMEGGDVVEDSCGWGESGGRKGGSGREGGHVYGCGWAGRGRAGPTCRVCRSATRMCNELGSLAWIYRCFSRHSNVSAWIFAARSTDFGYVGLKCDISDIFQSKDFFETHKLFYGFL